jgi:putative nucleotidyltransferase with HDIG domain
VTFSHLLNVSVLAMNFASHLGYKKDDCLDIGIAALFHDIGKIYVSRNILQKKEQLSAEEFEVIKSHTNLGAYMLLRYSETLGLLPLVVAFEHHRGCDGKGYPKLDFTCKPHPVSLLVAICDSYDALTQRRTYKRDYPPRMIYDIMMKERGAKLDSELVDRFFGVMGVWPNGTIVALSDSRIAIVRGQNAEDVFFPKVEIVGTGSQKQHVDLKVQGLSIQHSLNPLAEGKDYVDLL